ncbi:MAG: hypothetical protein WDZ85_02275 [Candidatus Paceibacterota bacterium]
MWAIYLLAVVGLLLSLAYSVLSLSLYVFFRKYREPGARLLAVTWPFFSLFLIGCEMIRVKVEHQEREREEYDNVVNFPSA